MIPASQQFKLIKMPSFFFVCCSNPLSLIRFSTLRKVHTEDSYKNISGKWIFLKIYFKSHFNQPHCSTRFHFWGAKHSSPCLWLKWSLIAVPLFKWAALQLENCPCISTQALLLMPSSTPFLLFIKLLIFLHQE